MRSKMGLIAMVVALGLAFVAATPALGAPEPPASAEVPTGVLVVTTTEDELNADGDCSLREAIRAANLNDFVDGCGIGSGDDTIRLPRGVYRLTLGGAGEDAGDTGDLDIRDNVRIEGDGAEATVVDGGALDRVFHIHPGVTASIEGVMITHGAARDQGGGGILNAGGRLTLRQVVLRGNVVEGGPADGGGGLANLAVAAPAQATLIRCTVVANAAYGGGGLQNAAWGSAPATLALVESTVRGNTAAFLGGGIWSAATGASRGAAAYLSLERSTVSHNVASGQGSYEGNGGGVAVVNSLATLSNSTLSGNQAQGAGVALLGGLGGGLFAGGMDGEPHVALQNVTVADNAAAAGGGIASLTLGGGHATVTFKNSLVGGNAQPAGVAGNCVRRDDGYGASAFVSQGHNLEDHDSCGFDQRTDRIHADPRLGPLADNGGPTQTHALCAGSQALHAGDDAAAPPTDQRGTPRPQCACSDIGAYEAGSLRVAAIRLEGWSGDEFRVKGWVQATDWAGAPVEGVQVRASLRAPTWGPRATSALTGADGWTPPLRWGSREPGAFTLCVEGLGKDGYAYAPTGGGAACRSITLPEELPD
jgi:CSLREA domain-containing protein